MGTRKAHLLSSLAVTFVLAAACGDESTPIDSEAPDNSSESDSASGATAGAAGQAPGGAAGRPSGVAAGAGAGATAPSFDMEVSVTRDSTDEEGAGYVGVSVWQGGCAPCDRGTPWPGSCEGYSDGVRNVCACDPPPWNCLETLRLERDGQLVAESMLELKYGREGFRVPDLFDSEDNILMIEGCGETLAVPIDTEAPVAVSDIHVSYDDDTSEMEVSWQSPAEASFVSITAGDAFMGDVCYREASATRHVFDLVECTGTYQVIIRAYSELESWDTAFGLLRRQVVATESNFDALPERCR